MKRNKKIGVLLGILLCVSSMRALAIHPAK